jgi:putative ubiquitin-RnfH superfamily antitoxin RatB of RatAB toxin-antitoxin module
MSERLSVQVCYALATEQVLIDVELPAGATLMQAIEASGILQRYPQIDLSTQKAGVFGKLKPLDTALADHDRVEIYRPLLVDPKVSRQRRVEKTRKAGSIGGRRWQNRDSR